MLVDVGRLIERAVHVPRDIREEGEARLLAREQRPPRVRHRRQLRDELHRHSRLVGEVVRPVQVMFGPTVLGAPGSCDRKLVEGDDPKAQVEKLLHLFEARGLPGFRAEAHLGRVVDVLRERRRMVGLLRCREDLRRRRALDAEARDGRLVAPQIQPVELAGLGARSKNALELSLRTVVPKVPTFEVDLVRVEPEDEGEATARLGLHPLGERGAGPVRAQKRR